MRKTILCFACLSMLSGAAHADTIKELLMAAIRSPSGTSRGIIEGKEADTVHQTTGSTDPLRGEVTTIKHYKQEGCSRLALKLIQPNTPTKQGIKTDFELHYELNLCQNGKPPADLN